MDLYVGDLRVASDHSGAECTSPSDLRLESRGEAGIRAKTPWLLFFQT